MKEAKRVTRILFVCHGNICRSPMAEFYMKDLIRKKGLENAFSVASAATTGEEITDGVGNPVYPPARRELLKHGISPDGKRARKLSPRDYEEYDLIVGMDRENLADMKRILGSDPRGKISLLLDHTGAPRDVADPWYTGDFGATWRDVETGCRALFEKLVKERERGRE